MFTMRLDLSLCGMWYYGALVLLVGVFFYNVEFLLYRGHTVLYALCMWLLVLSVCWCILRCCMLPLLVCYVLVGKSLSVVLSWGGSLSFSRLGGVVGLFLWLLEFQQGIKDFVGGYVRMKILT